MSAMDMMGGGPAEAPPSEPGNENLSFQEILNILQLKQTETEDPDEQNALAKAVSALTALVGLQAKQEDAAMGTTPAHKYVARSQGQGWY
jgi:hypothetical protein